MKSLHFLGSYLPCRKTHREPTDAQSSRILSLLPTELWPLIGDCLNLVDRACLSCTCTKLDAIFGDARRRLNGNVIKEEDLYPEELYCYYDFANAPQLKLLKQAKLSLMIRLRFPLPEMRIVDVGKGYGACAAWGPELKKRQHFSTVSETSSFPRQSRVRIDPIYKLTPEAWYLVMRAKELGHRRYGLPTSVLRKSYNMLSWYVSMNVRFACNGGAILKVKSTLEVEEARKDRDTEYDVLGTEEPYCAMCGCYEARDLRGQLLEDCRGAVAFASECNGKRLFLNPWLSTFRGYNGVRVSGRRATWPSRTCPICDAQMVVQLEEYDDRHDVCGRIEWAYRLVTTCYQDLGPVHSWRAPPATEQTARSQKEDALTLYSRDREGKYRYLGQETLVARYKGRDAKEWKAHQRLHPETFSIPYVKHSKSVKAGMVLDSLVTKIRS